MSVVPISTAILGEMEQYKIQTYIISIEEQYMIVASLEHIKEHNKNGGMKMRTIKTLKDIKLLREASVVKEDILQEMEEHFKHIYINIGEEEGIALEEFSLVDSGIIVLLEVGDNVTDLEEIGLNPKDNGLLGATPEWINEQKLADCTLITVCILCNNEYALSIFLERGKFGKEVENWISDNM